MYSEMNFSLPTMHKHLEYVASEPDLVLNQAMMKLRKDLITATPLSSFTAVRRADRFVDNNITVHSFS